MIKESLHRPVYEEVEMRCDDCNDLLGFWQWFDHEYVDAKCSVCNKEYTGDEVKVFCPKCRMGSN